MAQYASRGLHSVGSHHEVQGCSWTVAVLFSQAKQDAHQFSWVEVMRVPTLVLLTPLGVEHWSQTRKLSHGLPTQWPYIDPNTLRSVIRLLRTMSPNQAVPFMSGQMRWNILYRGSFEVECECQASPRHEDWKACTLRPQAGKVQNNSLALSLSLCRSLSRASALHRHRSSTPACQS